MLHLGFYNLQSYLSKTPASILLPEFTNPWEDTEPTINIDELQQYVTSLPYYKIFNSLGEFAVSSRSWEDIITSHRNKLNTEYGNKLLKS
ncbi:hypothetical protein [Vibrio sp. 10N.239.312.D08]|uniref:hypothetical protein n=1 Tax=Vibrio sp. 10N.239.312.D08 TaxID=3229978 RepID=UPI0035511D19